MPDVSGILATQNMFYGNPGSLIDVLSKWKAFTWWHPWQYRD
jgi:hypothetical protein